MRLHNFCIDHRISEEYLATMNGEEGPSVPGEKGIPSRWGKKPTFDRDGRPVDYLNWTEPAPGGTGADRERTRERLRAALAEKGHTRPAR
jgi:hypothetical protein